MTKKEYLTTFLDLINQEGPYHILSFTLEDEEEGQYWLTLQLPKPYDSFHSKNFLFALMFEEVNFIDRTVTFVVFYEDIVKLVDKAMERPWKDDNVKPVNKTRPRRR